MNLPPLSLCGFVTDDVILDTGNLKLAPRPSPLHAELLTFDFVTRHSALFSFVLFVSFVVNMQHEEAWAAKERKELKVSLPAPAAMLLRRGPAAQPVSPKRRWRA